MLTEPITKALKTLDDAGINREQSMATVKAIAELQQPLLEVIGNLENKLETSINNSDPVSTISGSIWSSAMSDWRSAIPG